MTCVSRAALDTALLARLPSGKGRLRGALEYAVVGGGHRYRPRLLLGAAVWAGGAETALLAAACAVEYVHAYSLIHDDLPAMDDDDMRRGRPSVHRAFGEATAILAGDALQAAAFACLAEPSLVSEAGADRCVLASRLLAKAVGAGGMVGGQVEDLELAHGRGGHLVRMSLRKTAALFAASSAIGAVLAGGMPSTVGRAARFGLRFGLLYQILDDVSDMEKDAAAQNLGRALGKARALARASELAHGAASILLFHGDRATDLDAILHEVWPADLDQAAHTGGLV